MKTASGAVAVQIVWSSRRGSRSIEHLGSAHDEQEAEALKAAARERLAAGQAELDLGLGAPGPGAPLPITSSRMGHLIEAIECAYRVLGFEDAAGGDEVFRHLVLARIIEPASKQDSLRVLEEAGIDPVSYPTLNRRLPLYAREEWRQRLSAACAAHARLGPASLVLYDVSTLYFETDTGDGFREPGFSKERRLEPQSQVLTPTPIAGTASKHISPGKSRLAVRRLLPSKLVSNGWCARLRLTTRSRLIVTEWRSSIKRRLITRLTFSMMAPGPYQNRLGWLHDQRRVSFRMEQLCDHHR